MCTALTGIISTRQLEKEGTTETQTMGYLVWAGLGMLAGAGGLAATGRANIEIAAVLTAVALIPFAVVCVRRLIHYHGSADEPSSED